MSKIKPKSDDVFFQAFIGEFVEVILDFKVPQNIQVGPENEMTMIEGPLTTAGFVLDKDDLFLLLSDDGENVSQAIQLKDIKHICIVDLDLAKQDELDERMLLDTDDIPDDDSFN